MSRTTACGMLVACLLVAAPAGAEDSVRPGANRKYLAPDMDVATWVGRFEVESREVFARRQAIVDLLAIEPGMAVADIGAGTGVFVPLLADAAGVDGRVYATEIAPAFLRHLETRVAAAGLAQVSVVRAGDRSTGLAPASVDLAFMCNVYHHLEYPQTVLADVVTALRPGGRLVIVDFEREPGATRPWLLRHVRAGRDAVAAEVEAAGFRPLALPRRPPLAENYVLAFERP